MSETRRYPKPGLRRRDGSHEDGSQSNEESQSIFDEPTLSAPISVLVVDDDPDVVDLTSSFLERERDEFDVRTETSAKEALSYLDDSEVDAIVSDYEMPGMDGLEFLEEVRKEHAELPFVLFTGRGSESIASEAISRGVTDYLQKESGTTQYSILANRLVNAVDRYRTSKTLKQSQKKFSKLVKNASDVIAVVNESGQFEYISPSCERVLGYSQADLTGTVAFEYMPPEDRKNAMEAFFSAVEGENEHPTIEFRFESPDEEWITLEARGRNMFDDEIIDGFVVIARDISALKSKQQELQQQNEHLKDVRQVITHDLRNPINVAADSLALYFQTEDDRYLNKVSDALERMDTLLDGISSLPDEPTNIGETEQISLKDVVTSAWKMIESDRAELRVVDSKEFEAEPGRLQQVFENLAKNAIEHSDGHVTVEVGTTDEGFYFQDDGPGIPAEERDKVFKSGYSTEPDHTGLGLNIVKQIALGHGWEIDITDGKDGGTCFEFSGVTFQPSVYS
ncbi:response regulator [Halapricum desulfuricans]|nr:response regulator [Halapricum desulfuricans]